MNFSMATSRKKRKIPGVIDLEPVMFVDVWECAGPASTAKKHTEKWSRSKCQLSDGSASTSESGSTQNPASARHGLVDNAVSTIEGVDNLDMGSVSSSAGMDHTLDKPKETDHAKYRRMRNEKWEHLRPLIIRALIEEKAPPLHPICIVCNQVVHDTILRCKGCGPMTVFCKECCIYIHSFLVLHQAEEWKDGQFVPFPLPVIGWRRLDHECQTEYTKSMTVLDHQGRPHFEVIHFCDCEDECVTLVRYGLWPATTLKPTVAVSLELLMSFRSLFCCGKVSLSAFAASLRNRYDSQYSKNSDVFDKLEWDMVLNFFIVHHGLLSQEAVCHNIVPTEVCPVCPKDRRVIAMDGNFSLVLRQKSTVCVPERHTDRFFFNQSEVDQHVSSYTDTGSKGQCSNFRVESVLRSNRTSDKLAVKGIFGSVCRHDYPYKFMDMKHGERLAYPVYLLDKVKDTTKVILYDLACKMRSHLEKRKSLPEGMEFSVPIFHVYGHGMSCQVDYSPRRIEGLGLGDGEGTERLWSFLGDFGNSTKEMIPANRRDTITELLLHYATRLNNKMVSTLRQKMWNACLRFESSEAELTNMLLVFPNSVTRNEIRSWSRQEKESQNIPIVVEEPNWECSYALDLHKYYYHREQTIRLLLEEEGELEPVEGADEDENNHDYEATKLDILLRKTERKQKIVRWKDDSPQYEKYLREACERERKQCLNDVRNKVIHYTFITQSKKRKTTKDGQAVAYRISKQLLASSKKVDTALLKYNKVPNYGRGQYEVSRATAMDLRSRPYLEALEPLCMQKDVPLEARRDAIDAFNINERSREELFLVVKDIVQFNKSALQRKETLSQSLAEMTEGDSESRLEKGTMASLKKGISDVNKVIMNMNTRFGPLLQGFEGSVRQLIRLFHNLDKDVVESPYEKTVREELR